MVRVVYGRRQFLAAAGLQLTQTRVASALRVASITVDLNSTDTDEGTQWCPPTWVWVLLAVPLVIFSLERLRQSVKDVGVTLSQSNREAVSELMIQQRAVLQGTVAHVDCIPGSPRGYRRIRFA
jgi:hypothetical protein